jgi:hypothetical protein
MDSFQFNFLRQFLSEEVVHRATREMMLAEIREHGGARTEIFRDFTFNRFSIRMDFQSGVVTIEDDLLIAVPDTCTFSLEDFAAALNDHNPPQ